MRSIRFVPCLALQVADLLLFSGAGATERGLSLHQRIGAQLRIEAVYHAHRLDTTRPFQESEFRAVAEAKVRDYLARSAALEVHLGQRITADELAEERARGSRRATPAAGP